MIDSVGIVKPNRRSSEAECLNRIVERGLYRTENLWSLKPMLANVKRNHLYVMLVHSYRGVWALRQTVMFLAPCFCKTCNKTALVGSTEGNLKSNMPIGLGWLAYNALTICGCI